MLRSELLVVPQNHWLFLEKWEARKSQREVEECEEKSEMERANEGETHGAGMCQHPADKVARMKKHIKWQFTSLPDCSNH